MSRNQVYETFGYPVDGGTQTVAFTGTAARTASGVGAQTRRVILTATSACHIVFGGNAIDATTADQYMPANVPMAFQIRPGQYVSAIQATAGGNLFVSEITV